MTNYVVGGGEVSAGITLFAGDTMRVDFGGSALATTVNNGGF